jgi:hypothetical protein
MARRRASLTILAPAAVALLYGVFKTAAPHRPAEGPAGSSRRAAGTAGGAGTTTAGNPVSTQ